MAPLDAACVLNRGELSKHLVQFGSALAITTSV
jgi:hypothetical protein